MRLQSIAIFVLKIKCDLPKTVLELFDFHMIAHDRPIAEKYFHIIADDRPIAEKCFHLIAVDRWQYFQRSGYR